MTKLFIGAILFLTNLYYAQTIKELSFESNVPDSENSYVAVPREKPEDGYGFGYIYFDENAGYTFSKIGDLKEENGIIKVIAEVDSKLGKHIQRIGNLEFKSAKIPSSLVVKLGYPAEPEWLKFYKSNDSENEKKLNRASKMNAVQASNLALPILQKLYSDNFKTPKLFFEYGFALNVLKNYVNAEKITKEAIQNKLSDDLVFKEHIFSLLNQGKIVEAENFLQTSLNQFKNEFYKAESIINLIAYSNHFKKKEIAKNWLKLFKEEIKSTRYNQHIEKLEKIINSNDSTSK